MRRGAEWRRHPDRGRPARFGPTEPSAVASPGLGGGSGGSAGDAPGEARSGSAQAARRGGLEGAQGVMTTPAACEPDCLRGEPPPQVQRDGR